LIFLYCILIFYHGVFDMGASFMLEFRKIDSGGLIL